MSAIPPRHLAAAPSSGTTESGEHRAVDPRTQARGPFVKKAMLEKVPDQRVLDLERAWAKRLGEWMARSRTSRDALGAGADMSGAYVEKILSRDVRCPVSIIIGQDKRHALALLAELEAFILEQSDIRRAG